MVSSQRVAGNRRKGVTGFSQGFCSGTNPPTQKLCFALAGESCTLQSGVTFRGVCFVYLRWSAEGTSIAPLHCACWNINQRMDLACLGSIYHILITCLLHHKTCGPPPLLFTVFSLVIVQCLYVSYKTCLHGKNIKMTVFVVSNWKYLISIAWPFCFPWNTHGNAATLPSEEKEPLLGQWVGGFLSAREQWGLQRAYRVSKAWGWRPRSHPDSQLIGSVALLASR